MKTFLFVIATLFVGLGNLHAGIIEIAPAILKTTPGVPLNLNAITTPGVSVTGPTANDLDQSLQGVLTVGIDHHYPANIAAYQLSMKVEVKSYNAAGAIMSTITHTFDIAYAPNDSTNFRDRMSIVVNSFAYSYTAKITQITLNGANQTVVPANVYVKANLFLDRIRNYTSASSLAPTVNDYILYDTDSDGNMDEIEISWAAQQGAEEYQLEWAFVNDYKDATTFLSGAELESLKVNFKLNSTRISTTSQSYRISLAFDHGYLVFRVRGSGRKLTELNRVIFSPWSQPDQITIGGVGGILGTGQNKRCYVITQSFEVNKNWQYSTTYAEEGKKKEVVSFFDGSLRNRQMVTKINSDNNTIVGETVYDHQGRPVIQVLPTPVEDNALPVIAGNNQETSLKYYSNFTKDGAGNEFERTDFDINTTGICTVEPEPMSTASGASRYYSPLNPDNAGVQGYLPDAERFPYSQVEYTPDNTGRIRRQGGVGDEFQLGTGHESKYFYAHPFQENLNNLFGSEVGNAAHYQKNMVVDPNGQVSVSYLDQEGRVIATALAGTAPTTLKDINLPLTYDNVTVDLFAKNAAGVSVANELNEVEASKEFNQVVALSAPSSLTLSYSMSIDPFTTSCLTNVCFSCIYDLEIEIRNDCGELIPNTVTNLNNLTKMVGRFTINPTTNKLEFYLDNTNCTYNNAYSGTFTTAVLPIGTYQITKRLSVNQEALDSYIDQYLTSNSNTCKETFESFETQLEGTTPLEDCDVIINCDSCVTALGSLEDFIANGEGTQADYELAVELCKEPCKADSYYETMYEQLRMDFVPGNQYAQYILPSGVVNPSNFPLSIFNTSNKLPVTNNYIVNSVGVSPATWKFPRFTRNGTTQFEYFEEDLVTPSRVQVTVTLNAAGAITSTNPPVINFTSVIVDPLTLTGITPPQNLANVTDFIAEMNANPSWTHSLVEYHPEYGILKTFGEFYNKFQATDPLSSEGFDALMSETDTWEKAVTNGFIKTDWQTYTNISDRLIDFTSTSSTNYDPFAINAGLFGSTTSDIRNKIFTNYESVNSLPFSMIQIAAMTVRCGSSTIGITPSNTCVAWGNNMPGYSNINDSVNVETRNKEWQAFRNLYYAYKQQIQLKAAFNRSLTQNEYEAYNQCIGNDDFDPFENNFLTVTFPSLGGEFFDELQPCSELTALLYAGKQKRFLNPLDQANMSANAVAYQQYLLTGQCPTAASFEAVLSELAGTNNLLNANYQLTNLDAYTGMILAENDYQLSTALPSRQWILQGQNTNNLSASIYEGATLKNSVALNSTASIVWSNVVGFQNLRVDNSLNPSYNFTVTAIVSSGGINTQVQLKGLTNFPIGACRFDEVCEANALGNSIEKVIKTMVLGNHLFSTSAVNLATTPYPFLVNTQLKTAATGVTNPFGFNFIFNPTTKEFSFYEPSTADRLKLTINSTVPANYTSYSSIVSLTDLIVKQDNTFDLVFLNNSGNTVIFKCDAIYVDGATSKAIPLGDCALPTPALCDNAEVSSTSNLFSVLKDVLTTQDQSFNLLNSIYVDAPLLSALPSTTLPANILSSVVSTTPPTIKFEYTASSVTYNVLELKIIQTTNSGVGFDQISSMTTPVLTGAPDNNGNYHSFIFTAVTLNSDTMTIEGTTNMDLQECGGCLESVDFVGGNPNQQTYSAANSQANLSTIMPTTSCQGKHSEYVNYVTNVYNVWATANGKTKATYINYNDFRNYDYCNCLDAYISYLNSIMDGLTTINNSKLLTINEICYATTTPPCTPNVNLNNNLEAIELPYLDPCAEFNQANLDANATTSYEQWVQQTTTELATAYTKHCLGALENFTMSYVDREQHFTLYYYDQAGNLIKTIPPEGVQKLGVYANPSINTAINNDRANGTHFVTTGHRMATTYLYNSLNQLVAQNMPDQDAADVFELTQANGLAIGLNTTAIQMLNENTGYLTGFVTVGAAALTAVSSSTVPFVSRSYVYITENGGKNWTRLPNTLGANLKKIAWSTSTPTTGYAIGEQGTLLYTNNGGQSWDLYNSFANSLIGEFVGVEVISETTTNRVYVTQKNGNIYYWNLDLTGLPTVSSTNTVLDPVTNIAGSYLVSIQDVEMNQTSTTFASIAPYGLATLNFSGKIFDAIVRKTAIGSSWQIVSLTTPELNTMASFGLNHALSFGTNGSVLEYLSIDPVTSASPVHPKGVYVRESGTINSFIQAFFVNSDNGIAKIQGLTQSEIMYTKDGGKNWLRFDDALFGFTLGLIEQTTTYVEVLASSTTKRIRLRLMTNGDIIFIDQTPDATQNLDFVSISSVKDAGSLTTHFGVTASGQVYRSEPLTSSASEIKFLSLIALPVSLTAKEILVTRTSLLTTLLVLTTSGKVYYSTSSTSAGVFSSLTLAGGQNTSVFNDIDRLKVGSTDAFVALNTEDNTLYTVGTSASALSTGFTFSLNSTGSFISTARLISSFGNKVYVSGTGSRTWSVNFTTITACSHEVRSTIGTLPKLNDINKSITNEFQVAGDNGRYISVASMAGTLIPTSSTKNLRAVTRFVPTAGARTVLVGQSGTLLAFNASNALISTATTSGSPIDVTVNYNDLNAIDFRSPSANVFSVYAVGENGSIIYTPDFVTTPFSGIANAANANLNGVKWIPGQASAHVVADDGKLFRLTNMSLSQNHNVFVQRLTDIHFADASTGTIIGINYTIRTTIDGGKTWKVVLPDVYPTLPSLNKVWTFKTSTANPHFAIVGGLNYIKKVYQNTVQTIQIPVPPSSFTNLTLSGNLADIQFSKSNPLNGYYLINTTNALRKLILTPSSTAGFTITSPTITPTGSIPGTAKAVHVFENQNVAILSTNGAITHFNTASSAFSSLLVAPSPAVTMNDIYFHDDVSGYMVGNNAAVFRLTSNSLGVNNVITSFSAAVIPTTTIANAGGNVADNITAIAFGSRYDGVYGGSYNTTTTTNVNLGMVRTLHDENQFFTARFFYDRLGRIVLSQNSRQYRESPQKKYSYTLYDALGRVTEAGEKTENSTGQKFPSIFGVYVGGMNVPSMINDANLALWLVGNGPRKEVTRSYYDASVPAIAAMIPVSSGFTTDPLTQRKRIVHVTYEEVRDGNDATYDHATHYDYDIHGNVESMLQDNYKLAKEATDIANQRFKKLDYKYDLISGNVHRVSYQSGQKDQWHHSYAYDADNRITNAYTTTATPISGSLSTVRDFQVEPGMSPYWDLEASYEYYDHGPLARTELAAEKVQGVDYVYTLQGWMKGMNSNNLTTANDPGKDGSTSASNHQNVAVDVAGFSLQYYTGDFVAATTANGNFVATQTGSDLDANSNDLYNGNIGTMVTTITDPNTRAILPLGNAYKYDQLNRLADARSFTNLTGNTWGTGGAAKYENNFAYDANGNITKQLRKDELGNVIDSLTYRYDDGANGRKRNRLYHVRDQVLSTAFSDDIDNMGTFTSGITINSSNNYKYDEEGRLKSDTQEGITNIVWRVDGKIKEIFRLDNTKKRIRFDYDAMGHRIAKHVGTTNTGNSNPATNFILESSTYYVLDAQGNTMSVYERTVNGIAATIKYEQAEKHIYGSSRLGVMNVAVNLLGTAGTTPYSQINWTHKIGQRTYELTNHLNNVLSVISDKVIPHPSGGSVAYYKADILQAMDYSPFGVTLKGRDLTKTGSLEDFRFGFNGMEADDEAKGEGNSYTTEFRQYDPRLGRWLTCDPLMYYFEEESPYSAFSNNPIYFSDPTGLAPEGGDDPEKITVSSDDKKTYTNEYLPATAKDGQVIEILGKEGPLKNYKTIATFSTEKKMWKIEVQFDGSTTSENEQDVYMEGNASTTIEQMSNSYHKMPDGASTPKETETSDKLVKEKIYEVAEKTGGAATPAATITSGVEASAKDVRKSYKKKWKAGKNLLKKGAGKSRFLASASKQSSKWGKIGKAASKVGRLLGITSVLCEAANINKVMNDPKSTTGQKAWAWMKGGLAVLSLGLKANPMGMAASALITIGSAWIDSWW